MSDQAVLLPKCSPMGESFWQKDSLITHLLFELWLIMIFNPVANFAQQSLPPVQKFLNLTKFLTTLTTKLLGWKLCAQISKLKWHFS